MESCAGGHWAATLLTQFNNRAAGAGDPFKRQGYRSDFGILCDPVISMEDDPGHAGLSRQLPGNCPDPFLCWALSAHLNVTFFTLSVFLWPLAKDPVVNVENSLLLCRCIARARCLSSCMCTQATATAPA